MNQRINEITYNITQVSKMTGLSKQVIRKWEERYGIVEPKRLDNGYRVYSQREVDTLLYIKSLVEQGQTVKQAAMHMKRQDVQTTINTNKQINVLQHPGEINDYVLSLLNEGEVCHETNMNRILHQAYHSYGLQTFLYTVVIPFLKEVGQSWSEGRWGEYQEALASLVVRDFLVQLRRNFQFDEHAPLLLGACLPYERHENALHIILLECMLHGWKTVMLGPSPAPNAIQATIEQLNPNKVVLSAMTTIPFEQDPHLLQELDDFATIHSDIRFYIGGPGAIQYTQDKQLRSIILTSDIKDILQSS